MALRDALEAGTRAEHEELERLLALDSPALTLAGYQEFLRLTHAIYGSVEPNLCASRTLASVGLDMRLRCKTAWLRADLDHFGVAPLAATVSLPLLEGGRAIGCAYVLESATLEGQVLHQAVAPRLGVQAGAGATFLAGYGPRTAAMWRGFVAALGIAAESGIDEQACVEAARETVLWVGGWFRQHGWQPA
jgi:heme oxygenase (biliverdin-IX-beta and delta-forming)